MVLYLKLMVQLSSMQLPAFLVLLEPCYFCVLREDGSEMDSGTGPTGKFSVTASVYINGPSVPLEAQCCDFQIPKLTCVYHLSDFLGSNLAILNSFSTARID